MLTSKKFDEWFCTMGEPDTKGQMAEDNSSQSCDTKDISDSDNTNNNAETEGERASQGNNSAEIEIRNTAGENNSVMCEADKSVNDMDTSLEENKEHVNKILGDETDKYDTKVPEYCEQGHQVQTETTVNDETHSDEATQEEDNKANNVMGTSIEVKLAAIEKQATDAANEAENQASAEERSECITNQTGAEKLTRSNLIQGGAEEAIVEHENVNQTAREGNAEPQTETHTVEKMQVALNTENEKVDKERNSPEQANEEAETMNQTDEDKTTENKVEIQTAVETNTETENQTAKESNDADEAENQTVKMINGNVEVEKQTAEKTNAANEADNQTVEGTNNDAEAENQTIAETNAENHAKNQTCEMINAETEAENQTTEETNAESNNETVKDINGEPKAENQTTEEANAEVEAGNQTKDKAESQGENLGADQIITECHTENEAKEEKDCEVEAEFPKADEPEPEPKPEIEKTVKANIEPEQTAGPKTESQLTEELKTETVDGTLATPEAKHQASKEEKTESLNEEATDNDDNQTADEPKAELEAETQNEHEVNVESVSQETKNLKNSNEGAAAEEEGSQMLQEDVFVMKSHRTFDTGDGNEDNDDGGPNNDNFTVCVGGKDKTEHPIDIDDDGEFREVTSNNEVKDERETNMKKTHEKPLYDGENVKESVEKSDIQQPGEPVAEAEENLKSEDQTITVRENEPDACSINKTREASSITDKEIQEQDCNEMKVINENTSREKLAHLELKSEAHSAHSKPSPRNRKLEKKQRISEGHFTIDPALLDIDTEPGVDKTSSQKNTVEVQKCTEDIQIHKKNVSKPATQSNKLATANSNHPKHSLHHKPASNESPLRSRPNRVPVIPPKSSKSSPEKCQKLVNNVQKSSQYAASCNGTISKAKGPETEGITTRQKTTLMAQKGVSGGSPHKKSTPQLRPPWYCAWSAGQGSLFADKLKNSASYTSRSSRSRKSGEESSPNDGRKHQKEYFKEELKRLRKSLTRESTKIRPPPKKAYTPYTFNALEPYYNVHTAAYLIDLPDDVHHGYMSRQTALGLTDPWVDHRMDHDTLPKIPSKPVTNDKDKAGSKKKTSGKDRPTKEGSTRLPKFPSVAVPAGDLTTKTLYYSDVPLLRRELKKKYTDNAESKVKSEYVRTRQDFYRMELDKMEEYHPINRPHMRACYFAYLQNNAGSKKAVYECVKQVEKCENDSARGQHQQEVYTKQEVEVSG